MSEFTMIDKSMGYFKNLSRDFPGDPVDLDFAFQCRWCGFNPHWELRSTCLRAKPKHKTEAMPLNKFNTDF